MRKVFLYRRCNSLKEDEAEIQALQDAGFIYLPNRGLIQPGDLVFARFCAYPFYKELIDEIEEVGAKPLTSFADHEYITDLRNYVLDLGDLTPLTWDRIEEVPEGGPYFLKGAINSLKGRWRTHCFAQNKREAIQVYGRLLDDSLISRQNIYIREFVDLVSYGEDLSGSPIAKEFRLFIYNRQVLSGAYYWSSHVEELKEIPQVNEIPKNFLSEAINKIQADTYVLDVAQKKDGNWTVIELNMFEMSGLSENNPKILYKNLYEALD